jgi:hypothetical protein
MFILLSLLTIKGADNWIEEIGTTITKNKKLIFIVVTIAILKWLAKDTDNDNKREKKWYEKETTIKKEGVALNQNDAWRKYRWLFYSTIFTGIVFCRFKKWRTYKPQNKGFDQKNHTNNKRSGTTRSTAYNHAIKEIKKPIDPQTGKLPRAAYLYVSKLYHPDKNRSMEKAEGNKIMQWINQLYKKK